MPLVPVWCLPKQRVLEVLTRSEECRHDFLMESSHSLTALKFLIFARERTEAGRCDDQSWGEALHWWFLSFACSNSDAVCMSHGFLALTALWHV